MAPWRKLYQWFICYGKDKTTLEDLSIDIMKAQNSRSMSKRVHPLAAEKSAECYASAPPMESYTQLSPTPFNELLAKQQRRLEEWDRDLRRREHALIILKAPKKALKNWPKIFPLIYHNIFVAVPLQHQSLIQLAYWTWKLTTAAYILNWVLIFVAFLIGFGDVSFLDWALVTISTACGAPIAFQMAYLPLYRAAEEGEKMDGLCWRFHMSCAMIWSFLVILGLPFLGHVSAGLWSVVIAMKSDADVMGLACFANTLLWTVVLSFQCTVFKKVRESSSSIQNHSFEEISLFQPS